MKKIFLAAVALFPLAVLAQTDAAFTLNGKISSSVNAPAKAFLVYRTNTAEVTDSTAITNGTFKFTGTVTNPVSAMLFVDYKGIGFEKYVQQNFPNGGPSKTADALNFFIDKGIINFASADSVSKAKFTGSPVNTDNQKLITLLKPVNDKAAKLMAESQAATAAQKSSPAFQTNLQAQYKTLQAEQKTVLKGFIKNNSNSYISLLALGSVAGPSPDVAELEPLFNSLNKNLRESEMGKALQASLESARGTSIGALAPDFTQTDVNGAPVKLSSFRGKYVLIDFWASWCGPCRDENPNVVRAYNKYKDKNFTVLGVSLDKESGRNAWLSAIKSDGLAWTQVSDLKFWNNEAAALYGVKSIPQNFLIGPDGKIVAKNLRGGDLEAKLAELLGKI